ncbi:MAG: hypothetical protein Q4E39_06320 [bacterium]|nr:hypothetical protein [bacterium]
MNEDLKIIKKKYGENMMKLCRELFPSLLEQEGLLPQLMLEHFVPSHDLYDDIVDCGLNTAFKNYIYNIAYPEKEKVENSIVKTPKELLDEAGYDLYECHSEEEIQAFRKYYKNNEALCTFRGNRLDRCHVFFAVKKNVNEIKRKDFDKPQRQDLYGTSVISIQFTRDEAHTLSIKNRYNHTVSNPDSTFSNNLDNIIPGLTESFEKYYGMIQKHKNQNQNQKFEIPNYVCVNGKYYKYNYEINNIYYCPGNIIIDNFEIKELAKEKYIVFDYFILDLVNKKISLYDESIEDYFVDDFNNIDTIEIKRQDNEKIIFIKNGSDDIVIKIDNDNKIICYINNNIETADDNYLIFNTSILELYMFKVKTIGRKVLSSNKKLKKLFLPEAETIGDYFLEHNKDMEELSLPKVKTIGKYVLYSNEKLKKLFLLEAKIIGNCFLEYNEDIEELSLPKVKTIGNYLLSSNRKLEKVFLPEAEIIGNCFLKANEDMEELSLPKAKTIGWDALSSNNKLKKLSLPVVETIGNGFLSSNQDMEVLSLPKVKTIGNYALLSNKKLRKAFLPEAETIGKHFLERNEDMEELSLPKVKTIGDFVLYFNRKLKKLSLPETETIGDYFLSCNQDIEELSLPKVKTIGNYVLSSNRKLKKLSLPEEETIGHNFLHSQSLISKIKLYLQQKYFIKNELESNSEQVNSFLHDIGILSYKDDNTDFNTSNNQKNKTMVKK